MGPVDIRIGGQARIWMLGILAFVAAPFPALFFELVGLPRVMPWVYGLPPLPRFALLVPMWALSMILLTGIASGVILFAERFFMMCAAGAGFIALAVERVLTGVLMAVVSVIQLALFLACAPVFMLGEWLWDVIHSRYALWTAWAEERRELRRIYRAQYAQQFATFRAFYRFYRENAASGGNADGGSGPHNEGGSASSSEDKFRAACGLLGLPKDGSFTHGQLKDHYRKAMKIAHPDAGGDPRLAAGINIAYETICKRKGWS